MQAKHNLIDVPALVALRLRTPDGGFTWQPVEGREASTGFSVSIYPARSVICGSSRKAFSKIRSYIEWNRDLVCQPDHYVDGWHDPETDKVHLDITVVVDSAEEAKELAREHNQIAYFDFAANHSVPVPR